jgi:hypothetical protein
MCSNIPASPAYGVYISQLICYARASSNYSDFLKRHLYLRNRLLDKGYKKILRQCSILTVNFWSVTYFGVLNFSTSYLGAKKDQNKTMTTKKLNTWEPKVAKIKHTRNENGQNFTHQNKTTLFWRKKAKIKLHQNFPIYGTTRLIRVTVILVIISVSIFCIE